MSTPRPKAKTPRLKLVIRDAGPKTVAVDPVPKVEDPKRQVVIDGFEKKSGLSKRVAADLERGIFEVACPAGSEKLKEGSESFKVYKNQYKRLCTHLRQNTALAKRIAAGDLRADKVAAMDDEALMGESQKKDLEQFRQESLQEALAVTAEDAAHWTPSDNYSCPRCESTKCAYIQSFKGYHGYDDNNQEPAITIRCMDCKHLWLEDEVDGGRQAAGSSAVVEEGALQAETAAIERPSIWADKQGTQVRDWLLPASS